MPELLAAHDIHKAFAGVRALRGVSFDVAAGEVHALVGENGAGKSTLIKILSGAEQPDAGTLTIADEEVARINPATAHARGIATIYQQPALLPDLSVAENIALAIEQPSAWSRVDWPARRTTARMLLEDAGAAIDPDRLAGTLSMPEQQIVEIARALGRNARVVIMDEPSASLSDREVDRLFAMVRRLRDRGAGVIYISHRLDEVFALADRITVLRDGQSVATRPARDLTKPQLVALMVGRDLTAVFPKRDVAQGDVVLDVRRLSNDAAGLHDISFTVRAGEILGIAGLVGSGRTELAETLFGLRPLDRGEIHVHGRPAVIRSPADAVRAGLAYVPEDRRRHGVIGDMSVAANTSLASLSRVSSHGVLDRAAERQLADTYVDRLGVKTPSPDAPAGHLSGGNQQKVALARWLATDPAVLVLDEPTQGVDVGAKAEIHALMQDLAERGLAVVMISSELPEIVGMSDRVLVMRSGRTAGLLSRAEATQERVLALALDHAPTLQ